MCRNHYLDSLFTFGLFITGAPWGYAGTANTLIASATAADPADSPALEERPERVIQPTGDPADAQSDRSTFFISFHPGAFQARQLPWSCSGSR